MTIPTSKSNNAMEAAVFGLIVADVLTSPMNLRQPPTPGGLQIVEAIQITTGGNVCNTGLAMQRLGVQTCAAGMIGCDALGVAVRDRLDGQGVLTSFVVNTDKNETSATIVAVEPGGERAFFHVPGATTLLDAAFFRDSFELFQRCAWVQI